MRLDRHGRGGRGVRQQGTSSNAARNIHAISRNTSSKARVSAARAMSGALGPGDQSRVRGVGGELAGPAGQLRHRVGGMAAAFPVLSDETWRQVQVKRGLAGSVYLRAHGG